MKYDPLFDISSFRIELIKRFLMDLENREYIEEIFYDLDSIRMKYHIYNEIENENPSDF